MLDTKSGSAWYVAGGNSTIGQMIADAGGIYIFGENKNSGSVPLSFETVFDKAQDVWMQSKLRVGPYSQEYQPTGISGTETSSPGLVSRESYIME